MPIIQNAKIKKFKAILEHKVLQRDYNNVILVYLTYWR